MWLTRTGGTFVSNQDLYGKESYWKISKKMQQKSSPTKISRFFGLATHSKFFAFSRMASDLILQLSLTYFPVLFFRAVVYCIARILLFCFEILVRFSGLTYDPFSFLYHVFENFLF